MSKDAFSLIGDALLAITESNVYRSNDDDAHADDALAFAVSLLVEARDLLRAPGPQNRGIGAALVDPEFASKIKGE